MPALAATADRDGKGFALSSIERSPRKEAWSDRLMAGEAASLPLLSTEVEMADRIEIALSLVGLRALGAGLGLVLSPRWFRSVITDFIKLSDNELRIIGYVLLGTGASIFAQRAATRVLSAKL